MSDDSDSPNNELDDVRRLVEEAWPKRSGPDDGLTIEDLMLDSLGREWDDGGRRNDQPTNADWAQIRADEFTRQELSAGRIKVGAPNVLANRNSAEPDVGKPFDAAWHGTVWALLPSKNRWAQIPLSWLFNTSMTARFRYEGMAGLAPDKGKMCLRKGKNHYPEHHLPGQEHRRFTDPERQARLRTATRLFTLELEAATAKGSKSNSMFSTPGPAIYGERVRARPTLPAVIANLWNKRDRKGNPWAKAGRINRLTLLCRVVPEYARPKGSGKKFRKWKTLTDALDALQDMEIIRYWKAEEEGEGVYRFEFRKGWVDRLGPTPPFPAKGKIAPYYPRQDPDA